MSLTLCTNSDSHQVTPITFMSEQEGSITNHRASVRLASYNYAINAGVPERFQDLGTFAVYAKSFFVNGQQLREHFRFVLFSFLDGFNEK